MKLFGKDIRLKLFPKIAVIMILVTIIPLVFTGMQLININRTSVQTVTLELYIQVASTVADNIRQDIDNLFTKLNFILLTQQQPGITWDERQSRLVAFVDSNPDIVNTALVDEQGDEIIKAYNPDIIKKPKLENYLNDPAFIRAKRTKKAQVGTVHFKSTIPVIDVVIPFTGQHYIYVTSSLENLWNKVLTIRDRVNLGQTGYVFVTDDQGCALIHPDEKIMYSRQSLRGMNIIQKLVTDMSATQNVSTGTVSASRIAVVTRSGEFKDLKGTDVVGAYAMTETHGLRWAVMVQQSRNEAFAAVIQMRNRAYLWFILALLSASIVAFLTARGLSSPVFELIKGARKVAAGDFTHQVQIGTKDELADLANTFNLMVNRLKEYADMQLDKLLAEKAKTEAIVFSIAEGIVLTDHSGKIILVNKRAKDIFGIEDTGWEGKKFINYLNNELRLQVEPLLEGKHESYITEIKLPKETRTLYYQLQGQDIRTLTGSDLGLLQVFHDITLEKEIEQMKDDFVHSITHDLRNPMTSIRGFLKFLLDGVGGPVTEQQLKMLQTMDRASSRLLTMINDILDVAKMESGKMKIELSTHNIREISERVIEIQRPLADRRGIKLILTVPETMNAFMCDGDLIERVFINLVGNAVKFTPQDGEIELGIVDEPEQILCWIRDTGEGIPEDALDKIFEKFQQVPGKQARGGTGIGLTVCRYAVEGHRGKIWVESKVGEGSTFKFTIPKNIGLNDKSEVVILNANKDKE
ncbi:MAG: ATP-binding protein [Elusimicrobiota bacterium]